jgi:hypothetical protein
VIGAFWVELILFHYLRNARRVVSKLGNRVQNMPMPALVPKKRRYRLSMFQNPGFRELLSAHKQRNKPKILENPRPQKPIQHNTMPVEEGLQEPLLERLSVTPEAEATKSVLKKRKRGAELEQTSKKAVKRSKGKKAKRDDYDDLNVEAGINNAFSNMDNQLLADYVAQRTRKFESELSTVELEDKYLPGRSDTTGELPSSNANSANAIRDTTSWDKPRDLNNLPGFLEKFSGNSTKLWSASKKNGAPHTIIVTGAGLRAADLARYDESALTDGNCLIRIPGQYGTSRRKTLKWPSSLQNISRFKIPSNS